MNQNQWRMFPWYSCMLWNSDCYVLTFLTTSFQISCVMLSSIPNAFRVYHWWSDHEQSSDCTQIYLRSLPDMPMSMKNINKTSVSFRVLGSKQHGEKQYLWTIRIITSKFQLKKSIESWQSKVGKLQKSKLLWRVKSRNHWKDMHQKPYGLHAIQTPAESITSKGPSARSTRSRFARFLIVCD